jgi:membrane fusion protein (multidrug efflux system)
MQRTRRLLIGLAIISSGALAGCGVERQPAGPGGDVATAASSSSTALRPAIAVEVMEAQPKTAADEQVIPAAISVENVALVLAQRDGIILQLHGQEGTRVVKGEALAQLGDDDLRSQLRQAELEVSRLTIEERQYEALVKVNRSELEQEQALLEDGLSSKRQVERAQFKLVAATHELEKTRLAIQTGQAKVEAAKIEIGKAVIRAPLSGLITRRHVKLGASVVKNDKLFEVAQLAPLEVKFQLPQAERGRLKPGQLVNLSLADNDRVVARARIRRLDLVADAASNTIGYLADVIGGDRLLPGLAVNVRVPRAAAAVTFLLPRAAFPSAVSLRGGGASTLFVLADGKCAARTVWVQALAGEQVEISSGLAANDRIILAPPAELKAGDAVEVKKR